VLRPGIVPLLLGFGLLAVGPSAAGTVHITDRLLAGLYPEPDATSEPLRLLSSGTPVEKVQQQGGYVRVRLPDHTTGWVESIYLTEDTPAQILLLEAQAKMQRLRRGINELRARLEACDEGTVGGGAAAAATSPSFEDAAQLEAASGQEETMPNAQSRVVSIETGVAQQMRYSPLWGLIGLASACLVAFLGGMVFQDRRGDR